MTTEFTTEIIDNLRVYESAIKELQKENRVVAIDIVPDRAYSRDGVCRQTFDFKPEHDMYKAFLSYMKKEALRLREQLKKNLDIESFIYTEND